MAAFYDTGVRCSCGHQTPSNAAAISEILRLREAMKRAADIIERELYHQREKVVDAAAILRDALERN